MLEHDIPRIAAIAVKLNEPEAPKFFAAITEGKPERFITSFQTPDVKPKTRITKTDLQKAMSGFVRSRLEEAERLINEDFGTFLESNGLGGEVLDIDDDAATQYLFRLDGDKWKVIFDGSNPFYLDNRLGSHYIDYLLHRPGVVITALELEHTITPAKAEVRTAEVITQKHDAKSLRNIARECRKQRAEQEALLEEGRTLEASQMDADIEEFERILNNEDRAVLGDSGSKARGNVSKAIRAVEGKLSKMEEPAAREFARHLAEFLHKGFKLSYTPPEKVIWS